VLVFENNHYFHTRCKPLREDERIIKHKDFVAKFGMFGEELKKCRRKFCNSTSLLSKRCQNQMPWAIGRSASVAALRCRPRRLTQNVTHFPNPLLMKGRGMLKIWYQKEAHVY
jgi:hypothetical protein